MLHGPYQIEGELWRWIQPILLDGDREDVVSQLADPSPPKDVRLMAKMLREESDPKLLSLVLLKLSGVPHPTVIQLLTRYRTHETPELRWVVVEALARLKTSEALKALVPALEDEDEKVSKAAAQRLAATPSAETTELLSELARSSRPGQRSLALVAAAHLPHPDSQRFLLEGLSDENIPLRRKAMDLLAEYGEESTLEKLEKMAGNPNPPVPKDELEEVLKKMRQRIRPPDALDALISQSDPLDSIREGNVVSIPPAPPEEEDPFVAIARMKREQAERQAALLETEQSSDSAPSEGASSEDAGAPEAPPEKGLERDDITDPKALEEALAWSEEEPAAEAPLPEPEPLGVPEPGPTKAPAPLDPLAALEPFDPDEEAASGAELFPSPAELPEPVEAEVLEAPPPLDSAPPLAEAEPLDLSPPLDFDPDPEIPETASEVPSKESEQESSSSLLDLDQVVDLHPTVTPRPRRKRPAVDAFEADSDFTASGPPRPHEIGFEEDPLTGHTRPPTRPDDDLKLDLDGQLEVAVQAPIDSDDAESLSPLSKTESWLGNLVDQMILRSGTDLHLQEGCPPVLRKGGQLLPLSEEAVSGDQIHRALDHLCEPGAFSTFMESGDLSFTYSRKGTGRLRCTILRNSRSTSATFRLVPFRAPDPKELRIPAELVRAIEARSGLILLAGPRGSGRTTTKACLTQTIATHTPRHVISLERPIEFLVEDGLGIVTQREVGTDTQSFVHSLRLANSMDADVVVLSEIPNADVLREVLRAIRTGRLVIAEIAGRNSKEAIENLEGLLTPEEQPQIMPGLLGSIQALASQCLVDTDQGERRAIFELLLDAEGLRSALLQKKRTGLGILLDEPKYPRSRSLEAALAGAILKGEIDPRQGILHASDGLRVRAIVEGSKKAKAKSPETKG